MEKLKLNVSLLHKAKSLVPTEVIVEKVVRLPRHFFAGLCEHPQNENPFIEGQIQRIWTDGQVHGVLFLDMHSGDGLLVGSGAGDNVQYIPHAAELLRSVNMTEAERQMHGIIQECACLLAEKAHDHETELDILAALRELGQDPREMVILAILQSLQARSDLKCSLLNWDGKVQIAAYPSDVLRFRCPVTVRGKAEPTQQIQDEINRRLAEAAPRGIMARYGSYDSINEKVLRAQIGVVAEDGRWQGEITCEVVGELSAMELLDLQEFLADEISVRYSDVLDERAIITSQGPVYLCFANELVLVQDAAAQAETEEMSEPTM